METYSQFCPVAVAAEVFANRWTPLILRELLSGASHFNEIQRCMTQIPRTTLANRLRELERAGVITAEHEGSGRPTRYRLTPAGEGFRPVIEQLGIWGQHSAGQFAPDRLDAELLMWNVRRRLDRQKLPSAKTTVRVQFRGVPASYRRTRVFWLLLDRAEVELCVKDPGADVHLEVDADLGTFARVWTGHERIEVALADGRIRLVGPRALITAFPHWLLLSHFSVHGPAGVAVAH